QSGPATVAAVVGAVVTVGTVPVELGAMGFTSVRIAVSSIAVKMTPTAAIANRGGVAAGSLVATLQSVEAAGLSVTSKVILGSAGTALGAWLGSP
uniref:Interferon alpha inducible protein 27 like 1 n=1 Tax=Chlorocebus sabaeus TaxID=60711 RepID=A0A0D9RF25_CHLSB